MKSGDHDAVPVAGIRAPAGKDVGAHDAWADEMWTNEDAALAAHEDARFFEPVSHRSSAGARFLGIVALVLLIHAALIAAFLWRDAHTDMQVAQLEETPVEVIVEKPPEPPKPKPPPPRTQPPPKPKEDLRESQSAPRAPNKEVVETQKTQPKTSAPQAPTPPSEGQPRPRPQIAQPKEAAPDQSKEDVAKAPDETKPDAEALDKAKPKVARQAKTKQAKAAPRRRQKPTDALASLAGSTRLAEMTFAKPTPKSPVYGGTDDVRWMAIVEGMLEAKVTQLPRTAHWQDGGHVVIFFHVDESGRVISRDFYAKSGYPDIDRVAMQALLAAAPFPPPPPGLEHGLIWGSKFDGQLPRVTVNRR